MTLVPSTSHGGGAPSGAAGGDLASTYPNPTIATTKLGAATDVGFPKTHLGLATRTAAGTPGANVATCTAFVCERQSRFNNIAILINTQAGNLDVGIYDDDDAGGLPGTRLASTGSAACPAGPYQLVALDSTLLSAGRYWAAISGDSALLSVWYWSRILIDPTPFPISTQKAASFPLPASLAGSTLITDGTTYGILPVRV